MSDEKIKFIFDVPEKDKAIQCYKFFTNHNKRQHEGKYEFIKCNIKIYLQMEEHIFE